MSKNKPILQFSHLSDEEYLKHLHTKPNPTEEDVESALRLELLLAEHSGLLERIHRMASDGGSDAAVQLTRIKQLTAPREQLRVARIQ